MMDMKLFVWSNSDGLAKLLAKNGMVVTRAPEGADPQAMRDASRALLGEVGSGSEGAGMMLDSDIRAQCLDLAVRASQMGNKLDHAKEFYAWVTRAEVASGKDGTNV